VTTASCDPSRDRYVSLATFRRDGREVRTPVWIAGERGRYYVFSEGDAGKVKRIRANGRAQLARCTATGRVQSEFRSGSARVLSDAREIATAYRHLHTKYGVWMALGDFFAKLSGRYARRAILEIRILEPETS
jgi:PPOX class probable F420-dependent enzyme